jgi:hypothetical protein
LVFFENEETDELGLEADDLAVEDDSVADDLVSDDEALAGEDDEVNDNDKILKTAKIKI